MDDETYAATLAAYESRIDNMSDNERREYFREDYDDESDYLYPEYMDFMDTWLYDFHYQACKHAEHFVKERLCGFEMRMVCTDHDHEFHLLPPSDWKNVVQNGEHVSLTKETMLDTETCWYKTILNAIHQLRDVDRTGLMDLTQPDHEYLKLLSHHYGRVKNMPDEKIQARMFQAYKNLWYYGIAEQQESLEYLKSLFDNNGIRLLIANIVNRDRIEQVKPLITTEPEILFSSQRIEGDHAYHSFVSALPEDIRKGVINRMNRIRMKAKLYPGLRPEQVQLSSDIDEMGSDCRQCKMEKRLDVIRRLSPPGILYAPPGMGKSTVARQGYYIGLDTDWLTSMLRNADVIWFASQSIPMMTNQYSLSTLSDRTMVGFVCPQRLRLKANGKPFTTVEELDRHRRYNMNNFIMLRSDRHTYLKDILLPMYIAQYCSDRTVELLKRWRTGPTT